jgi:hypothetical protein
MVFLAQSHVLVYCADSRPCIFVFNTSTGYPQSLSVRHRTQIAQTVLPNTDAAPANAPATKLSHTSVTCLSNKVTPNDTNNIPDNWRSVLAPFIVLTISPNATLKPFPTQTTPPPAPHHKQRIESLDLSLASTLSPAILQSCEAQCASNHAYLYKYRPILDHNTAT